MVQNLVELEPRFTKLVLAIFQKVTISPMWFLAVHSFAKKPHMVEKLLFPHSYFHLVAATESLEAIVI